MVKKSAKKKKKTINRPKEFKQAISKLQGTIPKEDIKKLQEFVSLIDSADLEKNTTPSPIAVGDLQEIKYKKIDKRNIEKFLLMHPVVPRGIDIKANRMIRRGYTIYDGNEKSRNLCNDILENSGGLSLIRNWIKDTYGFGGGYLSLVRNKLKDEVLFLSPVHPVFFEIDRYPKDAKIAETRGKQKIDPKTKRPLFYTQLKQKYGELLPVGAPIPADRIAHLKFDWWGDEPEGISLVQYLHMTITQLLNIEDAAAWNMYRHGQTQKVVETDVTSEKKLKDIAKNLKGLNSKDVIITPGGSKVSNLLPGQTQFVDYHNVFLTLLAIRLGIPKPLITMDGTSTNKATLDEQRKDVLADYFADELIVAQTIENQIFKYACQLTFGKEFTEIPSFRFNDLEDEKNLIATRMFQGAQASQMFSTAIKQLKESDEGETAKFLQKCMMEFLTFIKVEPPNVEERIIVTK